MPDRGEVPQQGIKKFIDGMRPTISAVKVEKARSNEYSLDHMHRIVLPQTK